MSSPGVAGFVGEHPRLVPVVICTVLLIMLIASIIRAFQRWEILPDPLLPEKMRNFWYAIQKRAVNGFVSYLSGVKEKD
ncbi:MAG TPA: hypothetical protein VII12_01440 [Thermoanaerobaculia bacterium]